MIERGRRCTGIRHAEDVQSLRLIGRGDTVTRGGPIGGSASLDESQAASLRMNR